MSHRWRITIFIIGVCLANALDQTVLSSGNFRPIDLTVVVLLLGTITGLLGPALLAAVLAGLLRSTTTLFPWFSYGLAYVLAIGLAWLVIRRVVAERSTASLLAAALAGSASFSAVLIGSVAIMHALDPHVLHIVWFSSAWSGLMQVIFQPFIVLFIWRLTGGGKFASVQESITRPF